MTRSRLLGLGLGTALTIALTLPSAATAKDVTENIAVSGPTSYLVTGHGWGHGRGMSQYGARGAAEQGVGWKQIVRFYYPGTKLGRARGPIKVLITADKGDVRVEARPGLRLRPVPGKKSFLLSKVRPRADRWRIVPRGQRSVVEYRVPGHGWKRWTSIKGAAEFTAGNRPTTLLLPGGASASYRGALRSMERRTVNVLPLERYVQGVVAREVPSSWPANAVRAQSVAARTYAAFERAAARSYYDICDTTSCQVYGGADAETPATNAAIKATRGRVITYQGKPAFTQFSSSNGGRSAAGSMPYLVAQADPYEAASGNPYATWTTTLTTQQIEKKWPALGSLTAITLTRDGNGDFGGRITKVSFTGTAGSVSVSGDELRYLMGPDGRSTWFKLEPVSPRKLAQRVFDLLG